MPEGTKLAANKKKVSVKQLFLWESDGLPLLMFDHCFGI